MRLLRPGVKLGRRHERHGDLLAFDVLEVALGQGTALIKNEVTSVSSKTTLKVALWFVAATFTLRFQKS